jgi:hypothetical protein
MRLGSTYPTVETPATVLARSQIVVSQLHCPVTSLPDGFAEVDIAVLDWIAAEAGDRRRT